MPVRLLIVFVAFLSMASRASRDGKSGRRQVGTASRDETFPPLPAFREPADLSRSPRPLTEFTQSFQSLAPLIPEAPPNPPATLELGTPSREEKGIASSQPRQAKQVHAGTENTYDIPSPQAHRSV